jgi:hypothetical protein
VRLFRQFMGRQMISLSMGGGSGSMRVGGKIMEFDEAIGRVRGHRVYSCVLGDADGQATVPSRLFIIGWVSRRQKAPEYWSVKKAL